MQDNSETKVYSNLNIKAVSTALVTILITVILCYFFIVTRKQLDNTKTYYSVFWKNADSTIIKSGPNWFLYDCNKDSIKSLKIINDIDKIQLLNLTESKEKKCNSYFSAIDQLTFKSNSENNGNYYLALILTAICGAIGVQLRTINNFIGVSCFKKDFKFDIWWPWYLLRPILGGLIGPILYILIDGNLYNNLAVKNHSQALIIGITVLAGFGSEDFLELLRKLSKRLFGTATTDDSSKPKA